MFTKFFAKILKSRASFALFGILGFSYFNQSILHPLSFLLPKIKCTQTIRANKIELVNITNSTKQQTLVLIYNKESEDQLKEQILKYCQIAQKIGINKVILVDQTDIRHLETFAKIIREDIEDQDKKDPKNRQSRDLQGKIKVMYISPIFDTSKPFALESQQTLPQQVKEIRQFLKQNPKQQQLKRSIQTFNRTTVIKNCYNPTCVEQYKQKIRQLIDLQLLRDKLDNYAFYVTTTKNEASKIAETIGQTANKQEIYVFRNDILGKSRDLYSQFLEKDGNKYENASKFMMMIRPRVHILSRKTLTTDLYWYISSLKMNQVPTFGINNTVNNFPVKIIGKQQNDGTNTENNSIIWLKGHYKQVQLIQKIKQKFENNIQVLILETNAPSQFFRHVYCPERYSIFKLTPQVPYPKMLIKPPTLKMDMQVWERVKRIDDHESGLNLNKINYPLNLEGDDEKNTEKWNRILDKINKFMEKPINYNQIKLYREKQLEINTQQLIQFLNNGIKEKQNEVNKWVFRVCGPHNNCLYSVYEKYGIDINIPVYTLDAEVQNVAVDQGDYQVQNGIIKILQ